jgi:hypothetical protein
MVPLAVTPLPAGCSGELEYARNTFPLHTCNRTNINTPKIIIIIEENDSACPTTLLYFS